MNDTASPIACSDGLTGNDSRAFERRIQALLGGHGSTARLARALGRSQSGLHRIWAGTLRMPEELVAIAELLELLPEEQWPERWRAAARKSESSST